MATKSVLSEEEPCRNPNCERALIDAHWHAEAVERIVVDRETKARAAALVEAADEWPIGVCAHRCFRTDEHVAPKDCLYGPDWLHARAARIVRDLAGIEKPSAPRFSDDDVPSVTGFGYKPADAGTEPPPIEHVLAHHQRIVTRPGGPCWCGSWPSRDGTPWTDHVAAAIREAGAR